MQNDKFEWDDDKAAVNLTKHRVSFLQASAVFADRSALERLDDTDDYGEDRFIITGRVASATGDKFVSVVYTERGHRKRIISARKATWHEQDAYFTQGQ